MEYYTAVDLFTFSRLFWSRHWRNEVMCPYRLVRRPASGCPAISSGWTCFSFPHISIQTVKSWRLEWLPVFFPLWQSPGGCCVRVTARQGGDVCVHTALPLDLPPKPRPGGPAAPDGHCWHPLFHCGPRGSHILILAFLLHLLAVNPM